MLSILLRFRRPGRHAALTRADQAHIEWVRELAEPRPTDHTSPRRAGRVDLASRRAGGAR